MHAVPPVRCTGAAADFWLAQDLEFAEWLAVDLHNFLPAEVEVTAPGSGVQCMQCHQ